MRGLQRERRSSGEAASWGVVRVCVFTSCLVSWECKGRVTRRLWEWGRQEQDPDENPGPGGDRKPLKGAEPRCGRSQAPLAAVWSRLEADGTAVRKSDERLWAGSGGNQTGEGEQEVHSEPQLGETSARVVCLTWKGKMRISRFSERIWLCFGYAEFERSVRNRGFLGGASGKEPAYRCRRHKRHGFNPWVRKILWRRQWQPTPVFLPGKLWAEEPGGLQSMELQRVGHD